MFTEYEIEFLQLALALNASLDNDDIRIETMTLLESGLPMDIKNYQFLLESIQSLFPDRGARRPSIAALYKKILSEVLL